MLINLFLYSLIINKKEILNKQILVNLPHIFKGASSSRRMGCDRKISRDLRQSPLISPSVNWTFLPGRAPRTVKDK